MVYKKFHLYLEDGKEFDLEKSVSIFRQFLDSIDEEERQRPNFNHYTKKINNQIEKRITIRFDFEENETEKQAVEVAESLVGNGYINRYTKEEGQQLEYIKIAHELASWCVVEFSSDTDFLDMHKKIFRGQIDPLKFFNSLLYLLFNALGFEPYFTWEQIAKFQNSDVFNRVISKCMLKLQIHQKEFSNPDFLERFIHLLLNCLLLQIPINSSLFGTPEPLETIFWIEFNKAQSLKTFSSIKKMGEKMIMTENQQLMKALSLFGDDLMKVFGLPFIYS